MTKPPNYDFKQISTPKATDKCLTLHSEILFANNIPFLITVAKPMNLLLCSELGGSRSSNNLSNIIVSHIMILKSQGFIVEKVYVDGEKGFAGCQDAVSDLNIEVVIVAIGEHINIAERAIRVVKERSRCIMADLP